ncbi:MAG: hypothetical protein ACQSGP_12415 [Frankia sp.]
MDPNAQQDSERPDHDAWYGEPVDDELVAAAPTASGPNVGMPIADGPATGDVPMAEAGTEPGTAHPHPPTEADEEMAMAAPTASGPNVGMPIADGPATTGE